jgi:hypothetical protein
MIGEMDIQRLRQKAEGQLGPRFDIKGFHAAVLGHGALPLTVLDQVMDRWIQDRQEGAARAAPASARTSILPGGIGSSP